MAKNEKFRFSSSVPIGVMSRDLPAPAYFDPHTQIFNNKTPGTLIYGSPGSGKTFCAMKLTCNSTIVGKRTVVIDPKGDFVQLSALSEDLGQVAIWDLASEGKGNRGVLDPFRLSDDDKSTVSLVTNTVEMMIGELSPAHQKALNPAIKDLLNESDPTLTKLYEKLRASSNEAARDLGVQLGIIKDRRYAELCFSPKTFTSKPRRGVAFSLKPGLTVISMAGMDISNGGQAERMSSDRRLTAAIFYLVTDFVRRVLAHSNDGIPATVLIDEAWVLTENQKGAAMIKELALLGRSRNVATILITQSVSHLEKMGIGNTISTRLLFRTTSDEALLIMEDMGLSDDAGISLAFPSLSDGECLMQDFRGSYGFVQIVEPNEHWREVYETNPNKKK